MASYRAWQLFITPVERRPALRTHIAIYESVLGTRGTIEQDRTAFMESRYATLTVLNHSYELLLFSQIVKLYIHSNERGWNRSNVLKSVNLGDATVRHSCLIPYCIVNISSDQVCS